MSDFYLISPFSFKKKIFFLFIILVGFPTAQLPLNSAVQTAFVIRLKAAATRQNLDAAVVSVRQPLPCSAWINCGEGAIPPSAKSQLLNWRRLLLILG